MGGPAALAVASPRGEIGLDPIAAGLQTRGRPADHQQIGVEGCGKREFSTSGRVYTDVHKWNRVYMDACSSTMLDARERVHPESLDWLGFLRVPARASGTKPGLFRPSFRCEGC